MNYTLINARPSPYGRKVAIALIEKGISYDVQYDVPWASGTCTPEYSPLEQLPILVSADDERIYDSTYILDWLEKLLGRRQYAVDGVDENQHEFAGEAIAER